MNGHRPPHVATLPILALAIGACGGSGPAGLERELQDHEPIDCASLPACWAEGIAHIEACIPTPSLMLTGSAQIPVCTAVGVEANLSSIQPTGALIVSADGPPAGCGEVSQADGMFSSSDTPDSIGFTRHVTKTDVLAGEENELVVYETGEVAITCDGSAYRSTTETLADCAGDILLPSFASDGDGAMAQNISLTLTDLLGAEQRTLFECTGQAG
ncbi:MAG: hypothetical protein AAF721_35915 [Myxococcota bacterium]